MKFGETITDYEYEIWAKLKNCDEWEFWADGYEKDEALGCAKASTDYSEKRDFCAVRVKKTTKREVIS